MVVRSPYSYSNFVISINENSLLSNFVKEFLEYLGHMFYVFGGHMVMATNIKPVLFKPGAYCEIRGIEMVFVAGLV